MMPVYSTVFHNTNLAETKGSGIRAMRKLMEKAHLVPPTFESCRENNECVSRLLFHHFLDANDLECLNQFGKHDLSDSQKQALIFVREVGAIDNTTYRQMADSDTLKASNDLRLLKAYNLLNSKGKGKATYYVAGNGLSAPVLEISTLPNEILERIEQLNQREHDIENVISIILDLCAICAMKAIEIASYLNKGEGYVKRKYLSDMIADKKLKYLHPEMINHPEQAYLTNNRP